MINHNIDDEGELVVKPRKQFCAATISALGGLFILGTTTVGQAEGVLPDYKASPDVYKVIAESDEVRVILATWPPGAKDKMHSHPKTFAVYTLKDCDRRLTKADGTFNVKHLKAGSSRVIKPVDAHYFENIGKTECQQVLFELK